MPSSSIGFSIVSIVSIVSRMMVLAGVPSKYVQCLIENVLWLKKWAANPQERLQLAERELPSKSAVGKGWIDKVGFKGEREG